jgi:hypothetical protein
MSTTRSRFAPKFPVAVPSGTASGPTVEQVLNRKGVVVFRIRTGFNARGIRWHELRAYTAGFDRIEFDYADARADNAIRLALLRLLFETYPRIDWTRDHDVHLGDGRILQSPEDNEPGWLPDEDRQFGGSAPVYVATTPTLAEIGATT